MLRLFNFKEKKEKYLYHAVTLNHLSSDAVSQFELPLPQELDSTYHWVLAFKPLKLNPQEVSLEINLERLHWNAPSFRMIAALDRGHVRFSKEQYLVFIDRIKEIVLPQVNKDFTINLTEVTSLSKLIEIDLKINKVLRPWFKSIIDKNIKVEFTPYRSHSQWVELKLAEHTYATRFGGSLSSKATARQWNEAFTELEQKMVKNFPWINTSALSIWGEF